MLDHRVNPAGCKQNPNLSAAIFKFAQAPLVLATSDTGDSLIQTALA